MCNSQTFTTTDGKKVTLTVGTHYKITVDGETNLVTDNFGTMYYTLVNLGAAFTDDADIRPASTQED
jgi:hypothetical protein